MAFTPQRQKKAFYTFSSVFKKQPTKDVPLADSDLDVRHNCTVEFEDNVERETTYDCEQSDIHDEEKTAQFKRVTLTYPSMTPQRLFGWVAMLLSAAAGPTGTPNNEQQFLERDGVVSGGGFELSFPFEGQTVTTGPLAWDVSPAQIVAALMAGKVIQEGDLTAIGGANQIETLTVVGTVNADDDLPVTVIAAGDPALVSPGKVINVALANGDTAAQAAGKIRAALQADADVGHVTTGFFGITGTDEAVVGTARAAAANDATMEISYPTALGLTGATSSPTKAGVATTEWGDGILFTFQGRLAKTALPLISVDDAAITGGGTLEISRTTVGGQNYHASTRSTDDQLAKTSIGSGYDSDSAADPAKFYNQVVEQVVINFLRRRLVTVTVTLLGRFTPNEMAAYDIPECENLPGLHGRDCKIKVNGQFLGEEFWSGTITLNNATPTGDDAFPGDDIEVGDLERGDQPTYPLQLQILGSEGDTIGEICRLEQKVPIEVLLGNPGERCSLIFPNVKMKFASNPRVFVGELNRSAHAIDAMPHKDPTLKAPLRAEAYLDQAVAFLSS